MTRSRAGALALAAAALLGLVAGPGVLGDRPAHAYEFEVRARTIGQGLRLRSFRVLDGHLTLDRRRFTQTLSLSVWDLTDRRLGRRLHDGVRPGPEVFLTTYLRINHDFGPWATGELTFGNSLLDAVDLIPELEAELLALDVLYAYAGAEDLAGGWLSV
ncbi:MAG: hypothetical protein AAGC55_13880, partial [Myxococcota bacterium]